MSSLVIEREVASYRSICLLLSALAILALGGAVARATAETISPQPDTGSILVAEYAMFGDGASSTWSGIQSDRGALGGIVTQHDGNGGSSLGRKAKAGFLSLILPGAGQFYNGDRNKAYLFVGAEAAVWAAYLTFHLQGNSRTDTYEEYARNFAGVEGEHAESYWQAVGRHMDSDSYNESVRREARALQETPANLIDAADAWQWRNNEHLETYQGFRADANRAFDRRDFMTLFAIVNRAVAVYDAVRSSVDDRLTANVLGFHVALEVSPSLHNPRTECLITRSF